VSSNFAVLLSRNMIVHTNGCRYRSERAAMQQCNDNPDAYPRVYRLRRYPGILWTCTGIGGILLGIASGTWFWNEPNMAPNVRPVFMAGSVYFLLFGVFVLAARSQYRFILDHDRIQLSSMLTRRRCEKTTSLACAECGINMVNTLRLSQEALARKI
jgi:hypothetical protein